MEVEELEALISSSRFETYVKAANGDRSKAVELYEWTGRLAGSIFEDFRHLEISFRNLIHHSLQDHVDIEHPNRQPGAAWFDEPTWVKHHWWDAGAKKQLKIARQRGRSHHAANPADATVAQLMFGFWRYVISARYEQSLWRPALDAAFQGIPGGTASDRRHALEHRVTLLLRLRNRIAHHEPIFKSYRRREIGGVNRWYDIGDQVAVLFEVLKWIDPDYSEYVKSRSNTHRILLAKP